MAGNGPVSDPMIVMLFASARRGYRGKPPHRVRQRTGAQDGAAEGWQEAPGHVFGSLISPPLMPAWALTDTAKRRCAMPFGHFVTVRDGSACTSRMKPGIFAAVRFVKPV